jgi:hypothetical protein
MEMPGLDKVGTGIRQVGRIVLCPACGAVMLEVDRLREDNHIFTWFECSKEDCGGQWLQKELQFSMGRKWSLSA